VSERDRWSRETLAKSTARFSERRERFTTTSDIEIGPLQGPDDPPSGLGFPGEFPFTRGVQPTMYRGRFWTMRQYAGFGTAQESNARYRYLLDQGTTGLSVAFDLPTQMGMDSDDPRCLGEVGKVGVAIDSVADMAVLFDQIPMGTVSTSMTINAPASVLLAMYVVIAERQGVPAASLRGTVQNDILKEYVARGTYIFPPRPSMRLVTDMFAWCAEHTPQWNTISISGYHIREAGSTAAQELAFTLADGIAYVQAAVDAGLEIETFARRLSFFFNAHNNFIEEVAKFRAARRMWAHIMRDRFGAKSEKSLRMRFHTQTAGSTLTAKQVDNNVVRVTLQALSAVLGGTQSLHTNGRDEALALPTAESARLALRTQQVIAFESGVSDFVDPLGGSWAVESVTDQLEAEATRLIAEIDELGGMVAAIEEGFPQREIQAAAYGSQLAVDRGDEVVVGVNRFQQEETLSIPLLKMDSSLEDAQVARTQAVRAARDEAVASAALDALQRAAEGTDNVMPHILHAVESSCTLGEIAHRLRKVFGVYRESPIL
jgi:methylmalonyl-CoA mutase N-terminal domain/subunit